MENQIISAPLNIQQDCWNDVLNNPSRIVKFFYEDETVWLKKASPSRHILGYKALDFLSSMVGIPLLKAVPQYGGEKAILTESRRLKELSEVGINVPKILWEQKDMLLLSDVGSSAIDMLNSYSADSTMRFKIIQTIFEDLKYVHSNNQYLSQGFARNITFIGNDLNSIGYLDFEDDPLQELSLEHAQARDILFLIFSTVRSFSHEQDQFHKIAYAQIALLSDPIQKQIANMVNKLSWVKRLPAKKHLGSDYHRFINTLDVLSPI